MTLVLKQLFPFKNLFKTLLSRSSQRVPPTRSGPPLNKTRVSPQLINPPLPKPWVNPKAYHSLVSCIRKFITAKSLALQSLSQLNLLHYKVYHSKVSCSAKLLTGQSLGLESLSQQSLLQCKASHSPVFFKRKLSPAYFTYSLLKSSGLELDFPILTLVLKQLFPFKNLFKTLLSRSSQRVPPTRCGPP